MSRSDGESVGPSARLVNAQWGFTAEWAPLAVALEQFAAHRPDLQAGLILEINHRSGEVKRMLPEEIRGLDL